MNSRREFNRVPTLLLVFASLLMAKAQALAQSPPSPVPDRPLRLADCLAISERRQPSLIVVRAKLAASESKLTSLESLDGPMARMRHDLPIRRQQARLGIDAANAEVARMESDNRYVVTRAYLSVLYARAQKKVLDELLEDLTYLRDRVNTSLEKKDRPEWTKTTVDLITLYLRRTQARRAEAERGLALGTAALREAMGLEPTVCFIVADEPLPKPRVQVCRDDIIAASLARRGEVIQADLASEASALETEAQAARHRRGPVSTFAAAADIHAKHVPQPIFGEEFRPGGIPLTMPDELVGPRDGRVETAQHFSIQATAVAQKTRNLAILEAEEAFYLWQEWSQKVVLLAEADEIGTRLGREIHEEYRGSLQRLIQAIVPESVLWAQTRTDYNEAMFRQAIALAALERVTGGAFHAGLADVPPPN